MNYHDISSKDKKQIKRIRRHNTRNLRKTSDPEKKRKTPKNIKISRELKPDPNLPTSEYLSADKHTPPISPPARRF